jgi:hypothetical protein
VLAWRSYCSRRRIHLSNYFGTRQSKLDYSLLHSATHFFPRRLPKRERSPYPHPVSISHSNLRQRTCVSFCAPFPSLPDLSNVPSPNRCCCSVSSDLPCFGSSAFFSSQHEFGYDDSIDYSNMSSSPSPIFTAHNSPTNFTQTWCTTLPTRKSVCIGARRRHPCLAGDDPLSLKLTKYAQLGLRHDMTC